VRSILHRLRDVVPILGFTVALTLAHALMPGRVGAAHRQRTQSAVLFFTSIDVGIEMKRRREAARASGRVGALARLSPVAIMHPDDARAFEGP
jgi:hypothetical protein